MKFTYGTSSFMCWTLCRGFDGDAAFAFQIHRIEHLGLGFTIRNRVGGLQ